MMKLLSGLKKNIYYVELLIAFFSFLTLSIIAFVLAYLGFSLVNFIYAFLLLFFVFLYIVEAPRRNKGYRVLYHLLFIALEAIFAMLFLGRRLEASIISILALHLLNYGFYLVMFLPLYFLLTFGVYLAKKRNKFGYILFIVVFVILICYFLVFHFISGYLINDEEIISFASTKLLILGIDPYKASFSNLLYTNATNASITVTTTNKLVGVLDYPALYLLSSVPFFLTAKFTQYNLMHRDLLLQTTVFIFVLMVTVLYTTTEDKFPKAKIPIILFLGFALSEVTSVATYLMMAIILLAYFKIKSRYAFLLLGLALAIQEEIWLPVLFLIAYSFNNQGFKRGMRNTLGAGLVFLAVSSYFIVLGPLAYFKAAFIPLSGYILPNGYAFIGYSLLSDYHVLLDVFYPVFILTTLLLLLILLYTNEKRFIFLFSFVPLLFLSHSIFIYYVTFIFLFVDSLYMKPEKKGKEYVTVYLKKGGLFYILTAVIIVSLLLLLYSSHLAYVKQFNISISNQSTYLKGNNTIYRGQIHYSNLANDTVYLLIAGGGRVGTVHGLLNTSLINTTSICKTYDCMVNINKIVLNGSNGSYTLTARIPFSNYSDRINYTAALLYNGRYFYASKGVYNSS